MLLSTPDLVQLAILLTLAQPTTPSATTLPPDKVLLAQNVLLDLPPATLREQALPQAMSTTTRADLV